jgi:hypothetical protein
VFVLVWFAIGSDCLLMPIFIYEVHCYVCFSNGWARLDLCGFSYASGHCMPCMVGISAILVRTSYTVLWNLGFVVISVMFVLMDVCCVYRMIC